MSRLHANYYSCGKYRFATPAPADESVLYSEGRYKTKLTAHDMPPWYMRGLYYGYADGFLNTKNVSKLVYNPNLCFNHIFKDDFLYISYNTPSKRRKIFNAEEPYDEYVWGFNIPKFLYMAKRYSGYDTAPIWQQIEEKRLWFQHTYPDDYKREVGDITDYRAYTESLYETI